MAQPVGSVVHLTKAAAAPTPTFPFVKANALRLTNDSGVVKASMRLDAATQLLIVAADASDVEGRNIMEGSMEQIRTVDLADGAVTDLKVNASADIAGSKLLEGSGPLTHLSSTGALDNVTSITARSLDDITDGATYGRVKVAGLTAGVVNSTGLTTGAVTAGKIATGGVSASGQIATAVVGTHQTAADSAGRNHNFDFSQWTRG